MAFYGGSNFQPVVCRPKLWRRWGTYFPSRLESLQFPPDFVQLSKRPSSASYLQGILVERQFKGKQVMLMTNKELVNLSAGDWICRGRTLTQIRIKYDL